MGESMEGIVLVDEKGEEHKFDVLDVVMVADNRYALLRPSLIEGEEEDFDEEEVYLFRVEADNDDEKLVVVEDEDEFNKVTDFLSEFDEMEDEKDPENK